MVKEYRTTHQLYLCLFTLSLNEMDITEKREGEVKKGVRFLSFLVLVPVVILKLLSPFLLIHPAYDLHRDEYLHLDQGLHLAWGYISVPPVTY